MKCSEIHDLLSAYFDGELAADLRGDIEAHLSGCAECSNQLAGFQKLSAITSLLEQPETPAAVWSAVQQSLEDDNSEKVAPSRSQNDGFRSRRKFIQLAATIAALVLLGFVGWTLMHHDDHDHEEMSKAMEQVAAEIDSDGASTLLLKKFGGREISYDDAVTQVGYRPIASKGLPEGYTVENLQVLDMPCCKCTQTACQRADKTRLFIYEHDNDDTGWFEGRQSRQSECCGQACEIVQLDIHLAVTWKKGNRHVTLLGIRDEAELELFISEFEKSS